MRFYYQGVDISDSISLHSVIYNDVAGDEADRLDITLNDTKREWAKWGVTTGEVCRFVEGPLETGVLYVDSYWANNGMFTIGAISVPPSAKGTKQRAFEDVRFAALASELAGLHGFSFENHGAPNSLYERMRQDWESDAAFLSRLATLESCTLKAYDKKFVVYDQASMESRGPIDTIDLSAYDTYHIGGSDARAVGACEVMTSKGPMRFDVPDAPNDRVLKAYDVMACNEGEALRFAKGIARRCNRTKDRCRLPIDLRTDITAGSVVTVTGEGVETADYYIYRAEHNLTTVQTVLYGRKPLGW